MKIQEGPAFGALIVGAGIGYLIFQKTANMALAVLFAGLITVAGYGLEVVLKAYMEKKK